METTIKREVTGDMMQKVFENTETVNIRYYSAECSALDYDPTKKQIFSVTIRHNENESPKHLFNKAVRALKNK